MSSAYTAHAFIESGPNAHIRTITLISKDEVLSLITASPHPTNPNKTAIYFNNELLPFTGLLTFPSPDSTTTTATSYDNGSKHGRSTDYYKTKIPKIISYFDNNQLVSSTSFYPNGTTKTDSKFKAGKRIGIEKSFFPNGTQKVIMNWSQTGQPVSKTEFRVDGTKSLTHTFANDNANSNQVLSHTVFQSNGITLKSTATATNLPYPKIYLVSIFNKFGIKVAIFHSPRLTFLSPSTSPKFIKNRYTQ